MKKSLLLIGLLLIAVGFAVTGCNSSGGTTTTITSTVTTTTATETTTITEATTTTTETPTTTTETTSTTTTTTSTTTTTLSASIAGKICFHAETEPGIRGISTISYDGPISGCAAVDTVTGTFEITGLSAGTYTLISSLDGWTIPAVAATVEAGSVACNLIANPTEWQVLRSGQPETLYSIRYSQSPNFVVIGGSNEAGPLTFLSEDNGETYVTLPSTGIISNPGNFTCYTDYGQMGGGGGSEVPQEVCSTPSYIWAYNTATTTWEPFLYPLAPLAITNEAIAAMNLGSPTFYLTPDHRLIAADLIAGSHVNVTPAGKTINNIHFNAGNRCNYIVGNDGYIAMISTTETVLITPPPGKEHANFVAMGVAGGTGDKMIVATDDGKIYMSDDTGVTWTLKTFFGIPYNIRNIDISITEQSSLLFQDITMVGDNGLLLRRPADPK